MSRPAKGLTRNAVICRRNAGAKLPWLGPAGCALKFRIKWINDGSAACLEQFVFEIYDIAGDLVAPRALLEDGLLVALRL